MRAGRLDRRITFRRNGPATEDALGAPVAAWSDLGTRWAEVRHGPGSERREAAIEGAEAPATFVVRADSLTETITTADMIRFAGADYDITSIVPSIRRGEAIEFTGTRRAT